MKGRYGWLLVIGVVVAWDVAPVQTSPPRQTPFSGPTGPLR